MLDKNYLYFTQLTANSFEELRVLKNKIMIELRKYPITITVKPSTSEALSFFFYVDNLLLIFKLSLINLIYVLNLDKELTINIYYIPINGKIINSYQSFYFNTVFDHYLHDKTISIFNIEEQIFKQYFFIKLRINDLYFFLYLILNIPYFLILSFKTF